MGWDGILLEITNWKGCLDWQMRKYFLNSSWNELDYLKAFVFFVLHRPYIVTIPKNWISLNKGVFCDINFERKLSWE